MALTRCTFLIYVSKILQAKRAKNLQAIKEGDLRLRFQPGFLLLESIARRERVEPTARIEADKNRPGGICPAFHRAGRPEDLSRIFSAFGGLYKRRK